MSDLSDCVALVTGASRGIGRKVAEDLASHGAAVAVAARSLSAIEECADAIRKSGGESLAVQLDVSNPEQVNDCVTQIRERFGKIDILVNNAGIVRDNLLLRMKEEEWRTVLSTNLDGVFYVTQAVIKGMIRERFGRVINITSVVGQMGNAGQTNYVASKSGLIGFTKALARELGGRNVTVNAVAPGFIETDMTRDLPEKTRIELEASIPVKRLGNVEDVAFGVRFLASKEAGYITGHVLNINGGMYM